MASAALGGPVHEPRCVQPNSDPPWPVIRRPERTVRHDDDVEVGTLFPNRLRRSVSVLHMEYARLVSGPALRASKAAYETSAPRNFRFAHGIGNVGLRADFARIKARQPSHPHLHLTHKLRPRALVPARCRGRPQDAARAHACEWSWESLVAGFNALNGYFRQRHEQCAVAPAKTAESGAGEATFRAKSWQPPSRARYPLRGRWPPAEGQVSRRESRPGERAPWGRRDGKSTVLQSNASSRGL